MRNIIAYGNSRAGFPGPSNKEAVAEFRDYILKGIFSDRRRGRYRYTRKRPADIIVLSWGGWAHGHFEIEGGEPLEPTDEDKRAFDRVKCIYLVRRAVRYDDPVKLYDLKIRVGQSGTLVSEDQFQKILQLVKGRGTSANPYLESASELEQQLALIRRRLGQSEFRTALLSACESRCAVTGYDAVDALEAAHIDPYCDSQSNDLSNGLLLRADIHSLFDEALLGIDPTDFSISITPRLRETSYSPLHGQRLKLAESITTCLNKEALSKRWNQHLRKVSGD